MERGKESGKSIKDYLKEGWKIEILESHNPSPYYIVSPRGLIYNYDQTHLNRCTICDPWDENEICIHDERDLEEGDEAVRLAELADEGD